MADQEELVFKANEGYQLDEEQNTAVKTVMDAWTAKMETLTNTYVKEATAVAKGKAVVETEAGPVAATAPLYPWWNLLMAGPFQPFVGVGPQKNFTPGQFAFVLGALWINPAPINWFPPGPSAAAIMAGWNMRINFNTINLTTVAAGPAIPPVNMNPIGPRFGPPWFKPFIRLLGPGVFPVPPQGSPTLYEMNVTADISGPVPLPLFAGYSTWVFDPDAEPATWPPWIPGVSRPAVPPQWQYDIPMRFLVYTA